MRSILIDAGPLIALFAVDDKHHQRFDHLVTEMANDGLRLVTTWPCIVEASYLLSDTHRFELLRWISLGGVTAYPIETDNLPEIIDSMGLYTEIGKTEMDLADASLYWLATETGIRDIMTTDNRDFNRYRLPGGDGFNLM